MGHRSRDLHRYSISTQKQLSGLAMLTDSNDTKKRFHINRRMIKMRIKRFLYMTEVGKIYQHLIVVLSFLSCLEIILRTYLTEGKNDFLIQITFIWEMLVSALFTFDWALLLYTSDYRMTHFFTFFSMVDLITVIPIWFVYFFAREPVEYEDIDTLRDGLVYFLYGAINLVVLRILRLHRYFHLIEDDVQRLIAKLSLSTIALILFDALALQYFETRHGDRLPFHDWLYFMTTSVATIGYGDIFPKTNAGRFLTMTTLSIIIIWLPEQVAIIIDTQSQFTIYMRQRYVPKANIQHVVFVGDLRSTDLREMFRELFHSDHEVCNINVVLLQGQLPSEDIHEMMQDSHYSFLVTYLKGNPMRDKSYRRACIDTASAVFFFSDKFSSTPHESDANNILLYTSIRNYVEQQRDVSIPFMSLQLLKRENRLLMAMEREESSRESIVSVNDIRAAVVIMSCECPGISTLLYNLVTSYRENDLHEEMDSEDEDDNENNFDDDKLIDTWDEELKEGACWEIYETKLSTAFEGMSFSDIALFAYNELNVLVFALRINELMTAEPAEIHLNPSDFVLSHRGSTKVEAYVLAKKHSESDMDTDYVKKRLQETICIEDKSKRQTTVSMDMKTTPKRRWNSVFKHTVPVSDVEVSASQLMAKKLEDFEHAESSYELDDECFSRDYHCRLSKVMLEEVTITTSLAVDYPLVEQHIILVARDLSMLPTLLMRFRLRKGATKGMTSIVIITQQPLPPAVWSVVSILDGLFFIQGNAKDQTTLRQAGIYKASAVLIIADPPADMQKGRGQEEEEGAAAASSLVDAESIFLHNLVHRMNPNIRVISEMNDQDNVQYLTGANHGDDYRWTPLYASGSVLLTSLVDSLVVQAFYNPHLTSVINNMLNIRTSQFVHSGAAVTKKKWRGSSFYQIGIPELFISPTSSAVVCSYGGLVAHFASQGVLVMGIYRELPKKIAVGAMMNTQPYVYTNPASTTKLFACDKLFVLSRDYMESSSDIMFKKTHTTNVVREVMRPNSLGEERSSERKNSQREVVTADAQSRVHSYEQEAEENSSKTRAHSLKMDAMVSAILSLTVPPGSSADGSDDMFSTRSTLEDKLGLALDHLQKKEDVRSRRSLAPGEWLDVNEVL